MAPRDSSLARPGIIAIVQVGRNDRLPVGECARCERIRPLYGRSLCGACRTRCQRDGTLEDYGYVKEDRVADYILARRRVHGDGRPWSVAEASAAAGISMRTGQRYEAELARAGRAPWRATNVNVQYAARRYHVLMARNL